MTGQGLIDLFTDSHMLAVPSFYESFGMVYLEGMAFGLPAIATTGSRTRDYQHGVDGYLIEPGDDLTGCLLEYHRRSSYPSTHESAARSRFDRHPTWEHTPASGSFY
jgi:glycosyltransferase involved in cell wall biosynthesis